MSHIRPFLSLARGRPAVHRYNDGQPEPPQGTRVLDRMEIRTGDADGQRRSREAVLLNRNHLGGPKGPTVHADIFTSVTIS